MAVEKPNMSQSPMRLGCSQWSNQPNGAFQTPHPRNMAELEVWWRTQKVAIHTDPNLENKDELITELDNSINRQYETYKNDIESSSSQQPWVDPHPLSKSFPGPAQHGDGLRRELISKINDVIHRWLGAHKHASDFSDVNKIHGALCVRESTMMEINGELVRLAKLMRDAPHELSSFNPEPWFAFIYQTLQQYKVPSEFGDDDPDDHLMICDDHQLERFVIEIKDLAYNRLTSFTDTNKHQYSASL